MRDLKFILKPKYETSRALIIGVNKYQSTSPLEYAVNDAEEIKNVLIQDLKFDDANIICLIDEEATKKNILKSFLSFTSDEIKLDDRLLVFFAGHGHTKSGIKGDVGYLVPYDADMDDYSSFIRWDELTRNAELIRAKHILFIMDACYGGLAVNRDLQAGSSRFIKDMYQRFSRQVITAGKANEVVSDAGGPLPNHSVFTGHLIEGIKGKAANEHGVITASGLMAYVYTKVANDINSEQTPHYGQFDGDGDFIVDMPKIEELSKDKNKDIDELISIPYADEVKSNRTVNEKIEYTKELLSSDKSQITLHDFVINEIRRFLSLSNEDNFTLGGSYSDEEFLQRLSDYELHIKDLSSTSACIAHWADTSHLTLLQKVITRTSDRLLEAKGGLVIWVNLRWYPLLLILYNAGIAAIEGKNYKSLTALLYTDVGTSEYHENNEYFVQKISKGISELSSANVFKKIPGHERNYAPLSEYIFKLLQPSLDDMLFLGTGYESVFDEFEVLYAIAVADLRKQNGNRVWGPIGRFGWKHKNRDNAPFNKICNEAAALEEKWPPIEAGMFGGDYQRFSEVAKEFKAVLDGLSWF